ncbi:MAG: hypothetical protein KJO50_02640 [Bacteroidia bacterium]|nr:hypothetical protein [Bacteroidia bacterium]
MKGLIQIFLLFCFFPYIDIIHIGTDTQPNALIFGSILLFAIKDKRLNGPIIILWMLFCLSLVMAMFSTLPAFITIKNILNYLSPALISLAVYAIFQRAGYRIQFRFFLTVVLIYMFVGVVQMFFVHEFAAGLVNQARGILWGGRGVISLTPEPAYYGSMCLFLLVFAFLNFTKKQNMILAPLLLVQVVFMAQSATAIAVLLAAAIVFVIIQMLRFRIKYVFLFVVMVFAINTSVNYLEKLSENSRAAHLFTVFLDDPLVIAQADASASVRLTNTLSPFIAMRHNSFMPLGFGQYRDLLIELYHEGKYRKLITRHSVYEKERLGGGINMILFHLGFIGLLFPLAIILSFKKRLREDLVLFSLLIFMFLLFSQIPLMHSMIGVIIATALFSGNYSTMVDKSKTITFGNSQV